MRMGLGEQLKAARVRKKLTASEVAADTHMKVQTVEAIEAEDFGSMAAPIYAKGFIKLYAEHVGLDPRPLIEEYLERFVDGGGGRPTEPAPRPAPPPREPSAPPPGKAPRTEPPAPPAAEGFERDEPDLFDAMEGGERSGLLGEQGRAARPRGVGEAVEDMVGDWADALRRAGQRARGSGRHMVDTLRQRREELKTIDIRHLSLKLVAAGLGVLVLLVFVVSSLSRCARSGEAPGGAAPAAGSDLALPDPPDLYLD